MHPKNLSIKDFTYHLPGEKIAFHPLAERDSSKLLVYKDGQITESIYKNITEHIPENSLLIFNNTKVIEARLNFQKPSGGVIEIFCLEPHEKYADITTAMLEPEKVLWKCLIGGASKWKYGQVLETRMDNLILQCLFKEKRADCFIVELSWNSAISFAEVLHIAGAIPLPPYIKRKAEPGDAERYQTIYARHDGSVAAPTAGLHFTPAIFEKLKQKNIQTGYVTLHVGAGTFKPVKTEQMSGHEMHAEFIDVSTETIMSLLKNIDNGIIAVGTTSLRTIESLYWMGVSLESGGWDSASGITQWLPYEAKPADISPKKALQTLLNRMHENKQQRLITKTQLLIAPGYKPGIVKGMVTNFHQPQSTLLLLIAALVGNNWRKIYDYALENNFRFLSYGDGSLLFF
jgi:S-adenosylmethionine:tRNA ribosyltransferase-isomerase